MFVNNEKLMEALKQLNFFVDVDIFWTDADKVADLVLPACGSFERAELQAMGPTVRYVDSAIKSLMVRPTTYLPGVFGRESLWKELDYFLTIR